MKHEWKKQEKEFYLPKTEPELRVIPEYKFFTLKGKGDPNEKEFSEGIGVLYSLAYGVKMLPKKGIIPEGYFEYSIYPLEAIWDKTEEGKKLEMLIKSELTYTMMIRQPDFVTEEIASHVLEIVKKKKPHPLLKEVRFESMADGLSVQMLHMGPYDNEPQSFKRIVQFCSQHQLRRIPSAHREIYITDARKTMPHKLKTVLRVGVQDETH